MGVRAANMPLDGSRTVLIGYGDEALWHERLHLHDVVVLTPDEDMFVEDLSRADSLRICGPSRELPRGIGSGRIALVPRGILRRSWMRSVTKRSSWRW